MTAPKSVKWTCSECGQKGEAPTRAEAVTDLSTHFGATHNQVPWMDE
jgi:hypothetical protein